MLSNPFPTGITQPYGSSKGPGDECGQQHLLLLAGPLDPIHAQLLGRFPV